jgi:hypothetical protein
LSWLKRHGQWRGCVTALVYIYIYTFATGNPLFSLRNVTSRHVFHSCPRFFRSSCFPRCVFVRLNAERLISCSCKKPPRSLYATYTTLFQLVTSPPTFLPRCVCVCVVFSFRSISYHKTCAVQCHLFAHSDDSAKLHILDLRLHGRKRASRRSLRRLRCRRRTVIDG